EVTYCYEVTNTGAITLTQHDLADTELGTVLNAFPYNLAPGASAFITATTTLTATTVSTATWTAYNAGPTNTATASDSATVNMAAGNATVTYCRNAVNLPIPDNNPAGVSDSLIVAESGTIVDVNVSVLANHTWVGDLIVTVTSPNATPVTIIDRPGRTTTGDGCGNNNVNVVLDDEGVSGPVETQCSATPPALFGNPTPNNPLSGFDSGNLNGTWGINISDNVSIDTGTLVDWCVVIEYTP
ncbi:MAG: hypothetical protein OT477_16230, partial [Chloroflexi bacterium]|nr:hypothetical protein [Chloroflexota bacterium]